jgi:hypothetical protein
MINMRQSKKWKSYDRPKKCAKNSRKSSLTDIWSTWDRARSGTLTTDHISVQGTAGNIRTQCQGSYGNYRTIETN